MKTRKNQLLTEASDASSGQHSVQRYERETMKSKYSKPSRFRSIVAGVAAVLSTSQLSADVVVMKSGKAHEGTVLSFDGKELTLEINDGKSILSRTEVDSVFF